MYLKDSVSCVSQMKLPAIMAVNISLEKRNFEVELSSSTSEVKKNNYTLKRSCCENLFSVIEN